MPRKFYRKHYTSGAKDKYSVERTSITAVTASVATNGLYQVPLNICPATPTQGMRKVKHITAQLTCGGSNAVLWWAVVFVPEGYSVNALNGNPGASMYEPNQFVVAAGVNDPDAGPIRIHSNLSRNLNSGDSLWLVLASTTATANINGMVQYAITLQ